MSAIELKSCPFCGRDNVVICEDYGVFKIHCVDCQIYFQKDGTCGRNYKKNITAGAWNRRAESFAKKQIIVETSKDREFEDYICPNCKNTLQQRRKGAIRETIFKYKHCYNCGQKLDWEG